MAKRKSKSPAPALKIDLGCGPHPREGFVGVDQYRFPGVSIVADLTRRWPWKDGEVAEAHASHFIEHLTAIQRVHFVNELYRVLEPGGTATIIVPHWDSCRAYGDPTHQWPPVSEFWFYYLSREWRDTQAPHTDRANWAPGFDCDFAATWGYGLHPEISLRNQEYQTFAINWYKEAVQDIHATLTKR